MLYLWKTLHCALFHRSLIIFPKKLYAIRFTIEMDTLVPLWACAPMSAIISLSTARTTNLCLLLNSGKGNMYPKPWLFRLLLYSHQNSIRLEGVLGILSDAVEFVALRILSFLCCLSGLSLRLTWATSLNSLTNRSPLLRFSDQLDLKRASQMNYDFRSWFNFNDNNIDWDVVHDDNGAKEVTSVNQIRLD